jgi:hypothetical protein
VEIFNNLEFSKKCDILRKHGRFVISLSYYQFTVRLYAWDRFFIEEYFDNEAEEVTRITMAEDHNMEKYLHDISLSDLAFLPGF